MRTLLLSEVSQSLKKGQILDDSTFFFSSVEYPEESNPQRQKVGRGFPAAGRKEEWGMSVHWARVSAVKMRTFWRLVVETVAQQCECAECHCTDT